jgi:hypothetical protein
LRTGYDQYPGVPVLAQREDRPVAQQLHEEEESQRHGPEGRKNRSAQGAFDKRGEEPQDVHGDYQGIVPLSSLDGSAGAKYALVAAGKYELQEALESHERHGQNEKSTGAHTELPTITAQEAD